MQMLRILLNENFTSANVFERNFKILLKDIVNIRYIFYDDFKKLSEDNFSKILETYNFFSPGYGVFHLLPWLMKLRNKFNLKSRVFFIAHAGGMHSFELSLSYNLFRDDDIIICPSKSTLKILKYFFKGLNIKTIPHPIIINNNFNIDKDDDLLVSFTRIHPDKLLHKIIDAINILKNKNKKIKYIICGDTNIPGKNEETQYTKILKKKIKDYHLEDNVKLIGEIRGPQKLMLLNKAKILLNLSVSCEESFGKSILEGILSNIPVIYTKWDGFSETAQNSGIGINVFYENNIPLIDGKELAKAILTILNNYKNFYLQCKKVKKQYDIKKIKNMYMDVFSKFTKKTQCVIQKDKNNILKFFPFFNEFSEDEILKLKKSYFEIIQAIVFLISRRFINFLQSRNFYKDSEFSLQNEIFKKIVKKDFYERLLFSIKFSSYQYAKEVILYYCLNKVDFKILENIFLCFLEKAQKNNNVKFLHVELILKKNKYEEAFKLWSKYFKKSFYKETDFLYIKQLSKICRGLEEYTYAEKILSKWLKIYPNSIYIMYILPELFLINIKMKNFKKALIYLNHIKIFAENKLLVKKFEDYYEINRKHKSFL